MREIKLTVNGKQVQGAVSDRAHLADFVRNELGLTGTHLGCEQGACGACTVFVDEVPVRSCLMLAVQADQSSVVTVEGLDQLGPELAQAVREAFHDNHGLQCGFCTPGFLISTADILRRRRGAGLDEPAIREELSGNICRCTGYVNIVAAVLDANRRLDGRELSVSPPR